MAAAIIASPEPARISRLLLAERAGEQTLRQIDAGSSLPYVASALSGDAELQPPREDVDAFGLIRVLFIGNPAQPAEAVPASRWAIPAALELHQAEQGPLQFPAKGGVGRGCARD